jgi:hypothetical protein
MDTDEILLKKSRNGEYIKDFLPLYLLSIVSKGDTVRQFIAGIFCVCTIICSFSTLVWDVNAPQLLKCLAAGKAETVFLIFCRLENF